MIATRDQIKTALQISVSTYDTLIDSLIVSTQEWLVGYLKNFFLDNEIYLIADTISFSANAIADSDEGFVDAEFCTGDYLVTGSKYNPSYDGWMIVNVSEVAAGSLTISALYTLNTEAADNTIRLTRVVFPPAMRAPFAKLIQFDMIKRDPSIKSFSLADYSEQYAGDGDYPPGLLLKFQQWKKPY